MDGWAKALGGGRIPSPSPRVADAVRHTLPAVVLAACRWLQVPGKEAQSTAVSRCVLELQRVLPRARFVYCSATGVSGEQGVGGLAVCGVQAPPPDCSSLVPRSSHCHALTDSAGSL